MRISVNNASSEGDTPYNTKNLDIKNLLPLSASKDNSIASDDDQAQATKKISFAENPKNYKSNRQSAKKRFPKNFLNHIKRKQREEAKLEQL